MSRKPRRRVYQTDGTVTLAAVLQVRDGACRRCSGSGLASRTAAPGRSRAASSSPGETLEASIRRHLAAKVDVREVRTSSSSRRTATPAATRAAGSSRPRTSGSCRSGSTPTSRGHGWHPVDELPPTAFDHGGDRARRPRAAPRQALVLERGVRARAADLHARRAARGLRRRARARRVGDEPEARAPQRRGVLEQTGERRASGRAGGRPAEVFRFRDAHLAITDPFAALRPRRR